MKKNDLFQLCRETGDFREKSSLIIKTLNFIEKLVCYKRKTLC